MDTEELRKDRKITKAEIGPMPKSIFSCPMPSVKVWYEDGTGPDELFTFYPDEIMFTQAEIIGLTSQEVQELKKKKDVAYLRSY